MGGCWKSRVMGSRWLRRSFVALSDRTMVSLALITDSWIGLFLHYGLKKRQSVELPWMWVVDSCDSFENPLACNYLVFFSYWAPRSRFRAKPHRQCRGSRHLHRWIKPPPATPQPDQLVAYRPGLLHQWRRVRPSGGGAAAGGFEDCVRSVRDGGGLQQSGRPDPGRGGYGAGHCRWIPARNCVPTRSARSPTRW